MHRFRYSDRPMVQIFPAALFYFALTFHPVLSYHHSTGDATGL